MSVYKWPMEIVREDGKRYGPYYVATFRDPLLANMFGTGFTIGEAIKDLKQVRRELIHLHEEDWDTLLDYRKITTNGRSK